MSVIFETSYKTRNNVKNELFMQSSWRFFSIIEKHIITKRTDIMKKIVLKNKLYIVKQVKNQPEDK